MKTTADLQRAPPDVNQFSIITELLGTPPDDVIQTICSENVSQTGRPCFRLAERVSHNSAFVQTLRFVQSLPKRERIPFSQKFRGADPAALDLLEKMLVFDPRKRIDATQSLAHEYLAPYHDPTDEPVAPEPFDWSFNDADLPVDTWKVMMYSEILDFQLSDGVGVVLFAGGGSLTGPLVRTIFSNIENTNENEGPVSGPTTGELSSQYMPAPVRTADASDCTVPQQAQ